MGGGSSTEVVVEAGGVCVPGFPVLGAPSPWPPALEKKVPGGRHRSVMHDGVWAGSKVAERCRPGWWLPAVGLGPGWGATGVTSERLGEC